MHRFRLEIPADTLGTVLPALARLRAIPATQRPAGRAYAVEGHVPAGAVHELAQLLPSWTRGEGVLEYEFDHYRPVTGPPPQPAADRPQPVGPQGLPPRGPTESRRRAVPRDRP